MAELSEDIETIVAVGGYEDEEAVIDDALRELLRRRPDLRLSVAIERYRTGTVSLNRAAELAGVTTEAFKTELTDRGLTRDAGFLDEDERDHALDEFTK